MPIRFRCAYCNQLMGIARRKAGTVVSCPTCHGQVVVPTPSQAPGSDVHEKMGDQPVAANVFERQDFDPDLLNPRPAAAAPIAPVSHPPTVPLPAEFGFGEPAGHVPTPAFPVIPQASADPVASRRGLPWWLWAIVLVIWSVLVFAGGVALGRVL